MDWFLYDIGLGRERVKNKQYQTVTFRIMITHNMLTQKHLQTPFLLFVTSKTQTPFRMFVTSKTQTELFLSKCQIDKFRALFS